MSWRAALALVAVTGAVLAPTIAAAANGHECRRSAGAWSLTLPRGALRVDADVIERRDDGRVMVFTGGVVVRQADLVECADRVTIHLDATRAALVRTVASGNVRIITSNGREGTAARAEYRAADYRVVLSGRARLSPDEGWPSGDDIFVYLPAD